jgi:uncharacterized protein
MTIEILAILAALLVAGGLIGFLAGLFGIGGGAISVPIFFEVYGLLNIPEDVRMPLAVGTSLAVIIPTSLMSARAHQARGTIEMGVLRVWVVPLLLGILVGTLLARVAEPALFQIVFVLVAGVNAVKLLTGGAGWRLRDGLPGRWGLAAYGWVVGVLSTLMGIGGGAITNLILTLHGVPIHRAVSTGAGVGVIIALPATLGYVWAGWGKPGLPFDATGYVSWLTFAATVPTTLLTARAGVALAHRLSRRALETAFGVFLLLTAARFLWALL